MSTLYTCVGRLSWWCCSTLLNTQIGYERFKKSFASIRRIRTNFAKEASKINQFVSIRSTVKMLRKLLVLSILIAFCANCNSYYYNGRNATAPRANVAMPPPYNGYQQQPPVWNTPIKRLETYQTIRFFYISDKHSNIPWSLSKWNCICFPDNNSRSSETQRYNLLMGWKVNISYIKDYAKFNKIFKHKLLINEFN